MEIYQVKKYFSWGSLRLEPLQYLHIEKTQYEDRLNVTQEKNRETIVVSTKAFDVQIKLGTIAKTR